MIIESLELEEDSEWKELALRLYFESTSICFVSQTQGNLVLVFQALNDLRGTFYVDEEATQLERTSFDSFSTWRSMENWVVSGGNLYTRSSFKKRQKRSEYYEKLERTGWCTLRE